MTPLRKFVPSIFMPSIFMPSITTISIWTIAYAAWTADWIVQPMPHLWERSVRRLFTCAFGIMLCEASGAILGRTRSKSGTWRVATALVLCVGMTLAYSAVNTLVFYIFHPLWGTTTLADVLDLALTIGWVFIAWAALYFAMDADAQTRDARLRLAEVTAAELRARNMALSAQIQPHFLFNALNTVSGLILDGMPGRAERVTLSLARLLRRSLESDGRGFVPLSEELEAVGRYLEIEEARFEDRFRYVEAIPEAMLSYPVPPMILQPLIENAMRHGVARSIRPVTVTVSAEVDDGSFVVRVNDDTAADEPMGYSPGKGIGQANVRQRLSLIYGLSATLECRNTVDGYEATIRLPLAERPDA